MNEDISNTTLLIKKLYKYKMDIYKNETNIFSKYNIPLKLVKDYLKLKININTIGNPNKNEDKKLIDKLILTYTALIDGKYYFSYENVNKFLVALKIDEISDLTNHLINILLCAQDIYEYYIRIINKYNNLIINNLIEENSTIKDIITKKIEIKYSSSIINKDDKIKLLEKQIEDLLKENKIEKKKNVKIQLINGEPIIDEDYCNLCYSQDHTKKILSTTALNYLKNKNISDQEARKILLDIDAKNKEPNCKKLSFKGTEKINRLFLKN